MAIKSPNGGLTLRWLTDPEWTTPILLRTVEDRNQLTEVWPERVQFEWRPGFVHEATTFLEKLRGLLEMQGASAKGLEQCESLVQDKDPSYLPTTISLQNKVRQLCIHGALVQRAEEGSSTMPLVARAMAQIVETAASTFPGSAARLVPTAHPCLVKRGAGEEEAVNVWRFCAGPLNNGDLALYHPGAHGRGLPLRLGRALRVIDSSESPGIPYVIMEAWWPLHKWESFGECLNLFGTWIPSALPVAVGTAIGSKERTLLIKRNIAHEQIMVDVSDVLVWPVVLEPGAVDAKAVENGTIPFAALRHARERCPGLDLSSAQVCFSRRGAEFRRTLECKRPRCN